MEARRETAYTHFLFSESFESKLQIILLSFHSKGYVKNFLHNTGQLPILVNSLMIKCYYVPAFMLEFASDSTCTL